MTGQSPLRIIARHAALAVLVMVCGLAFAPAFGGRLTASQVAPAGIVIAVVVGALVPAAVVAAGVLTRAAPALVAVIALVVTSAAIAVATRCGTGVFHGPRQLLTAALPAPADPAACGTVAAIVAFASLAAALIAGYARLPALAVLPGLVCLLAALALDASIAFPPAWFAAVIVALTGVALALLRAPTARRRSVARTSWLRAGFSLSASVILLAAAGAIGLASSHSVPAVRPTPAAAQDLVSPPLQPRAAVQPMTQYPAFANGTDVVHLRGSSSSPLAQLSMVTLGTFTGQTWTTTTHFRRAGETLRAAPAPHRVTVSITAVDARNLSWLVRPDRPSSVDRRGLGVDPESGDLVVPSGTQYPGHYRVVGSVPVVPTVAESADPPVAWKGPVAVSTGVVPASIVALAAGARPAGSGYLQLITLQNRMHGGAFRSTTGKSAPSGCGYVQVDDLLNLAGNHIGTSEQYASAFAIAARVLGYDARVVLGFRPEYARDKRSFTIRGADVRAWAQVQFTHAGWVNFDPTPTQDVNAPARSEAQAAPAKLPRPSAKPPASTPAHPSSTSPPASAARESHLPASALLVPVVAVLVLCILALPAIKAIRRRRRRRAPGPARAVYGAWQELNDRLREFGMPPGRGRSTAQVIAAAPPDVRPDMYVVGTLVDHAGYAPESARTTDVLTAWAHADVAITTIRSRMAPWRRAVARLDPRSLRRQ